MIKRLLMLSLFATSSATLQAQDSGHDNTISNEDLAAVKQTIETVCAACHGADGNSQLPDNPKLAAQIPEYLFKQLVEFKAEGDAKPVRENAVMNAMVATLEKKDMLAIAKYFSQQKAVTGVAENLETVRFGERIWRGGIAEKGVPACSSCHGPAGAGMPAQFPRIAGQHAKYTLAQLQAFREGGRHNSPAGMMRSVALKMTDAEMKAVADYAAGLY